MNAWYVRSEKQKGWTALMVAFKFYTSAAYIIKSTQGIESQKPRGKRKGSMSSTFMVSAFVRNLEHKTRERKKITGPLAKYADKPSFRCCIMSIRWFFDTRKSIWKNFSLAVKKVLRRFLVRYYLRKQYKFFVSDTFLWQTHIIFAFVLSIVSLFRISGSMSLF